MKVAEAPIIDQAQGARRKCSTIDLQHSNNKPLCLALLDWLAITSMLALCVRSDHARQVLVAAADAGSDLVALFSLVPRHLTECGRWASPSDSKAPAGCSASPIFCNARASECRPPGGHCLNRKCCVCMWCFGGLGICNGAGKGLGPQLDQDPAREGVRAVLKEMRQSPRPRLSVRSCCA